MSAAETYAARVDAVLAQRTRLRGPEPPGDLFAGLPASSPLFVVDAHNPSAPNLDIIASYVESDDVIIDVGGGGGRFGLPLALRCRQVINIDPSAAMVTAFEANAKRAGIVNVCGVQADWMAVDPPVGSLALVKHVTYLTRAIVPFIEKLEAAATRRVLLTVNSPTPLEWNRELFELVFNEVEESAPGHVELVNVLMEMGIEPDVQPLPLPAQTGWTFPSREVALQRAIAFVRGEQWAHWPLDSELETRARDLLEARFDDLFKQTADGYLPTWPKLGHEILVTWKSRH